MRVLAVDNNECFIACGDRVVAVSFSENGKNVREFLYAKTDGHLIITLHVSGGYVFAGYSNKHVCCWDIASGEFLGSGVFKKRPTSIVYSSFERNGVTYKAVLVSDKTGEVWGSDVPSMKKQTILAGHTASIITDMTIGNDLVVTADRDEKIRVSRFPDLETIISYCFHHTSVVSSTNFINAEGNSLLVSSSWDHQLCLWNPSTGKLLDTHQYIVEEINAPSSSTEVVETPEESEAAEVEANTEEGNDDEEVGEKTYDEISAGHYPCKVATTSINNIALAAVIFKNATILSFHRITSNGSSSGSIGGEISEGITIELPAVPSDIIFIQSDKLVVLLPATLIMIVYHVSISGENVSVVESTSQYTGVAAFQKKCNDAGITFSQVVDQIDADASEEKGMKKHMLDKPFDKDANINYQAKRGAKRSKKH